MPAVPPHFGYLLVDTSRLYLKSFARQAAGLGVTLNESKALGYVARNEGISQARLAELCDLEPMTLVRILDRMETEGWIERRADASDRRIKRLFLTPSAQSILDELLEIAAELRERAMSGLLPGDRTAFMHTLEHLYETLSADECPKATSEARAGAAARPMPPAKGARGKPLAKRAPRGSRTS
jgi:DNA-binding MarR family transcriptional regulator